MKLRKILSVLCAAALLVSALPAASAVEAEPLSEYAGKTIPVQVVEETKDGLTSRIIKVAIPEGATKAEEDALVASAALGESDISTFSTRSRSHVLSRRSDLIIRWQEVEVGGGSIPANSTVDKVTVDVVVSSFDRDTAKLYLQVRNVDTGDSGDWRFIGVYDDEDDASIVDTDPPTWRLFYIAEDGGLPAFGAGQGVDVYAKMSGGNVSTVATCTVRAYY